MDKSVMIAYTEVDTILDLMDEEYQKKIPEKLRNLISKNKLNNYNVMIDSNIPLTEQNISRKALAILAVLNYNYWCDGKEKQKELMQKYMNNEKIKQQKIRKQYDPNNLFNNKNSNNNDENIEKQLIIYNKKDSLLIKIINKIKKLLKIDIIMKK